VRRQLLRGGLAAAPVLLTVTSRPVMGQACSMSIGMSISMKTSLTHECPPALGLAPQQWKAKATQWPSPYCGAVNHQASYLSYQQPTLFHCPTTGLGGSVYGDRTMLEVIDFQEGGHGIQSMGRYIVAALLNARAGLTPVLPESTVRDVWNNLINLGYYEPTPGVKWGPSEIIAYIKTTYR
jgi:hypothetical protein